jgi:hypothetical protein
MIHESGCAGYKVRLSIKVMRVSGLSWIVIFRLTVKMFVKSGYIPLGEYIVGFGVS